MIVGQLSRQSTPSTFVLSHHSLTAEAWRYDQISSIDRTNEVKSDFIDTLGMAPSWLSDIRRINRNNFATLRAAPWAEISGSLGDLGTLLPLMIALAAQGSIDLGSTLVFTGIFNILTGAFYGIPLPVQPMKVSEITRQYSLFLDRWVFLTVLHY